jgi:hypothetical protein
LQRIPILVNAADHFLVLFSTFTKLPKTVRVGFCYNTEKIIENTEQRFEDNNIDNVTYRHWMTTDISDLETTVQSCSDFTKSFAEKLNILLYRSFVAWHQSCFYKEVKLKLKTGEIGVT